MASRKRRTTPTPTAPIRYSPFAVRLPSPFAIRPSWRRLSRSRLPSKYLPQPVAEFAPVIFAHGVVGDGGGGLAQARLEGGAPLRSIEAAGLALAHPQHIRERAGSGEHLADRIAPAGAH